MNIFKKTFFYAMFFLISVSLFILLSELTLTFVHHLTHGEKFKTFGELTAESTSSLLNVDDLYLNDLCSCCDNRKKCVKIAIFGESAADGYNSTISFEDIIRYELKNRYPEINFYIMNYAQNGYPFHRAEAKILKSAIKDFDIFLIYAGNNEYMNYVNDSGYFRSNKYKKQNLFPNTLRSFIRKNKVVTSPFFQMLYCKNRLYLAVKFRYKKYIYPYFIRLQKMLKRIKTKEEPYYRTRKFKEFEINSILPREEINKMYINYKNDLEEIASLAKKFGKHVIISNVVTNESYKPFFSVLNKDLTNEQINVFFYEYHLGVDAYKKTNYEKALEHFLKAFRIDDTIAILNYYIGTSYVRLGYSNKGREFLQKSIDTDGFLLRAPSFITEAIKEVSQNYSNVYFIDSVKLFHDLLDQGLTYKELMSDLHHPSAMGHIVIAYSFLSKISELNIFGRGKTVKLCQDFNHDELCNLVNKLKSELNITHQKEQNIILNIARWHTSLATMTPYFNDYLDIVQDRLMEYYVNSEKTKEEEAIRLFWSALIEAIRGDAIIACDLANKAFELDSIYVRDTLYRSLGIGEQILLVLERYNILFKEDKFITINNLID